MNRQVVQRLCAGALVAFAAGSYMYITLPNCGSCAVRLLGFVWTQNHCYSAVCADSNWQMVLFAWTWFVGSSFGFVLTSRCVLVSRHVIRRRCGSYVHLGGWVGGWMTYNPTRLLINHTTAVTGKTPTEVYVESSRTLLTKASVVNVAESVIYHPESTLTATSTFLAAQR